MRRAVAAVFLVGALMLAPTASAAPYVSCIDGHIAPTLQMCPPPRHSPISVVPRGGGPHGGGGGLFGTIGRVLGGLTGGLL